MIKKLTIKTCPICLRVAREHSRTEMDVCYAKYLELIKEKFK